MAELQNSTVKDSIELTTVNDTYYIGNFKLKRGESKQLIIGQTWDLTLPSEIWSGMPQTIISAPINNIGTPSNVQLCLGTISEHDGFNTYNGASLYPKQTSLNGQPAINGTSLGGPKSTWLNVYSDEITVKQAPVIQQDSDGTSLYCKFYSGTMIAYCNNYNTTTTTGGAFGITFPSGFIESPALTVTPVARGASDQLVSISSVASHGATCFYVSAGNSFNNQSITVNYIAIGRWK